METFDKPKEELTPETMKRKDGAFGDKTSIDQIISSLVKEEGFNKQEPLSTFADEDDGQITPPYHTMITNPSYEMQENIERSREQIMMDILMQQHLQNKIDLQVFEAGEKSKEMFDQLTARAKLSLI